MIITNCTSCGATLVIFYGVIMFVSGISHRVTFVKYVSVARDNCRTVSHEICTGWWWRKTCHTEEKQMCNGHIYVHETRHGIRCQYGWRDKDPGDCSVPICLYCGPGTQCTAPYNCTDIDECVAGTHRCSFVCINTIGSYKCACSTGYRLKSDRRTCEVIFVVHPVTVIDECETETHNCSDVCINTNGSYECGCHTGYTLKFDRRTCEAGNRMMEVIGNGPQTAAICACSLLLLPIIVLIILIQRRKKIAKQNCTTEEVEMSKDEDIYQNEAPVVEEAIYDSLDMADVDGGDNHLYEPMRKITTYLKK